MLLSINIHIRKQTKNFQIFLAADLGVPTLITPGGSSFWNYTSYSTFLHKCHLRVNSGTIKNLFINKILKIKTPKIWKFNKEQEEDNKEKKCAN